MIFTPGLSWPKLQVLCGLRFGFAVSLAFSFQSAADLQMALPLEPQTLDWSVAQSSAETFFLINLMEGLMEEGPDQQPRPCLAESHQVSSDGKKIEFTLKKDIFWSDGRALTAQDFLDSWWRLIDPALKSENASLFFEVRGAKDYYLRKIKDKKKVGFYSQNPRHLAIELIRPSPHFLHLLTFWATFPIRRELNSGLRKGQTPVLGPFQLKQWTPHQEILLELNPRYHGFNDLMSGGWKREDQVRVRFGVSAQQRLDDFQNAKLDFLGQLSASDFLKLKSTLGSSFSAEKGGVRLLQFPYFSTYYLGFNFRKNTFPTSELRRAIGSVLDRSSLPWILKGGQVSAQSFVPPGMSKYQPPVFQPMPLEEARRILAQEGWGKESTRAPWVVWIEEFEGADLLQAELRYCFEKKLGQSVHVEVRPLGQLKQAVEKKQVDLLVRHWGADFPDPSNFLNVFTSDSGSNSLGLSSLAYDRLLQQAQDSKSEGERIRYSMQAEHLLIQIESALVPLFHAQNLVLVGPKVEHLEVSPLNYLYLKKIKFKLDTQAK